MKDIEITALKGTVSELGESPLWDHRLDRFYWVDVMQGKLSWIDMKDQIQDSIKFAVSIGAIALTDDVNQLLLATGNGFAILNLKTEELRAVNDPEEQLPENRFNDGKVDPLGRFWAGTMAIDGKGTVGSLYCLDAAGQVTRKLNEVACSNGLAWNKSHDTFYYIDTGRHCIDACDYDLSSGAISNRHALLTIAEEAGYPDGMCIDEEGKLWVALWGSASVIRLDPESQSIIDRIHLPVSQITSCAFGGANFSTLYITSANIGLSETEQLKEPLAGSVFTTQVGVGGLSNHLYKL